MASQPTAPPAPASSTAPSRDSIFNALTTYAFDTDDDFFAGLSSILGHPSIPPTPRELEDESTTVLQAKCFYFARKHNLPPIDPEEYTTWLEQHPNAGIVPTFEGLPHKSPTTAQEAALEIAEARLEGNPTPVPLQQVPSSQSFSTQPAGVVPGDSGEQQPPYPTSFAEIVDLITNNKPVPGIEEIPDTVLELGSSKVDHTPQRKKPWETTNASEDSTSETRDAAKGRDVEQTTNHTEQLSQANGPSTSREDGVARILQPNAIAPSGLVADE